MFVRHPLERLASAYADKIATIETKPLPVYDQLRRRICQHFYSSNVTVNSRKAHRHNVHVRRQIERACANNVPSFAHFIEYLMSHSIRNDVHWQPYSNLCQVCRLKYNFIGKYETMEADLEQLLSTMGLDGAMWKHKSTYSTGRSKDAYRVMYTALPDRIVCFLQYFYRYDVQLFDYRLDDYIGRPLPNCSAADNRLFTKPL
jgi:hypothetical protein